MCRSVCVPVTHSDSRRSVNSLNFIAIITGCEGEIK